MTYLVPSTVRFVVVRASATVEARAPQSPIACYESLALVLRAEPDTSIRLTSDVPLPSVDVHFTLSTKWCIQRNLDLDLESEDIGFLAHTLGTKSEPLVHGAAMFAPSPLAALILRSGHRAHLDLVLPTAPFAGNPAKPYAWGLNRQHMLRISRLELGTTDLVEGAHAG